MLLIVPNIDKTFRCTVCGHEWVRPATSALMSALTTRCNTCKKVTWHQEVTTAKESTDA